MLLKHVVEMITILLHGIVFSTTFWPEAGICLVLAWMILWSERLYPPSRSSATVELWVGPATDDIMCYVLMLGFTVALTVPYFYFILAVIVVCLAQPCRRLGACKASCAYQHTLPPYPFCSHLVCDCGMCITCLRFGTFSEFVINSQE